jgi:hypothetical protein
MCSVLRCVQLMYVSATALTSKRRYVFRFKMCSADVSATALTSK